MQFAKYPTILALIVFALSLSAFAKDRNEGKFTLSEAASVGSTQLHPGDYKATWEGSGSDVQVKILQGKNVVAASPAKLADNPTHQDAVTVKGESGSRSIDQIDFAGARKSLAFSSATTAQK